jgi:hypothetical protein
MGQPSCANFTNDFNYSWFAGSDTGPVIFAIVDDTTDDASFCQTGTFAHSVDMFAYATSAWPSSPSNAPQPTFVDSLGNEVDASSSYRATGGYLTNGTAAEFKITLCQPSGAPLSIGLYFVGGNGYCFTDNGGAAAP